MDDVTVMRANVIAAIVGGIVANPNLTDGDIYWDQIIEDANEIANKVIRRAKADYP